MRRTVKGSAQRLLSRRRRPFDRRRFGRPEGQDIKGSERDQLAIRAILSSERRAIQRGRIKPARATWLSMTDLILRAGECFVSERLPKTRSRNRLDRYFNAAQDLLRERAGRSIQFGEKNCGGNISLKMPR